MVRTKRRPSSDLESYHIPKKRKSEPLSLKSPDSFSSHIDDGIILSSTSYQYSQVYPIKGIIGENSTSYLVDWADNSQTGEAYSPSWVCLRFILHSSGFSLFENLVKGKIFCELNRAAYLSQFI